VLLQSLDLVFVAVYQQMLAVPYAMTLLHSLKAEFATVYKPNQFSYPQFDEVFKRCQSKLENQMMTSKMRLQGRSNGASGSPSQVQVFVACDCTFRSAPLNNVAVVTWIRRRRAEMYVSTAA
jgi:hypothetical protein